MGEVKYSINGKYFKDYGIYVSSSLGLLDALKRKPIKTYDWAEYHGESLDLSNPKFEAREIALNCFIKGNNYQINAIRIYQVEAINISKRNQQIFLDALKYQAEIAYNTRPLIQIQKDIAELNSKVKKPLAGLDN